VDVARSSDVQQLVTDELKSVRSQVCGEFELFSITNRSHADKGQRMLYLFQRDLMPGVNGQILESKQQRDTARPNMRSASTKLGAWLFIVTLALGMLFYILLFALDQTKKRQSAWFRSFMMWLVLEIFLTSTAVVYVTHILIPMIAMRDVNKIKQKLLSTIRDHYSAMKRGAGIHGSYGQDAGADTLAGIGEFNAAEYLFVSYRLAKLFPELRESSIILRYATVWPKQSYLHKVDVTKSYSNKFSSVTTAVSMILIFIVTNLLSVPPAFQDMLVHIASTATIGYTILLHVQLFQVYPVLVVVPALLVAMIAHFLIKGGRAKAKAEIAKLMPVEEKARRRDKNIVSIDSIDVQVMEGSGKKLAEVGPAAVTDPGNATFKTRRASIQAGKVIVKEIMQLSERNVNSVIAGRIESKGQDSDIEEGDTLNELSLMETLGNGITASDRWYIPLSEERLRAFENDSSATEDEDDDADVDSEEDESHLESISLSDDGLEAVNTQKEGFSLGDDGLGTLITQNYPRVQPRLEDSRFEVSGQYISDILQKQGQSRRSKVGSKRSSASQSCIQNPCAEGNDKRDAEPVTEHAEVPHVQLPQHDLRSALAARALTAMETHVQDQHRASASLAAHMEMRKKVDEFTTANQSNQRALEDQRAETSARIRKRLEELKNRQGQLDFETEVNVFGQI
jgi:hypothetical protein